MKEKKYVKLKVNMYEDTKFKIIDTMEDRDLINYIWTRLITLAGKVNLNGNLYMSRSIPYTVETLAIEFNRSIEKVQLALKVLKNLEMMELTKEGVYRVINFAKHQNIKMTEKSKNIDIEKDAINIERQGNNKENITKNIVNNNFQNKESRNNEHLETSKCKENDQELKLEHKLQSKFEDNNAFNLSKTSDEKSIEDKDIPNKEGNVIELNNSKNQNFSKDNANKQNNENLKENLNNNFDNQVKLKKKRTKKNSKKKDYNEIKVIDEEDPIGFSDGIDIPKGEGYSLVKSFDF